MAKLIKYTEWNDGQLHFDELPLWAVEQVEPQNGTDFSLKELRGFIGGHIEIVPLTKNRLMIVDEEGKLKGLPLNPMATKIYDEESFCVADIIVGNALICKRSEVR